MKIIHFLYSGLGGHGNVFFSLVDADKKKEFEYIALFIGIEPLRNEYKMECEKKGIPFFYINKKKGIDFKCYKSILAILRKVKPEIIFLHGSSFILPASLYKLSKKTKIIVRDTQAHHLKSKKEWIFLSFALILANNIVLLTTQAANRVRRKFKLLFASKKLRIIGNGINVDNIRVNEIVDKKHYAIGMQGRLQKIKDHSTLIKSFAAVCKDLQEYQLLLKIAGSGETLAELKLLCAELDIADKVEFYGMLDQTDLNSFMSKLDIYVHASFGESMSTAIMQAMAYGLPIIASDVFGINNMLNKSMAILVPVQNVDMMTNSLKELILNTETRQYLGRNSREYAIINFSNKKMFKDYKALFRS